MVIGLRDEKSSDLNGTREISVSTPEIGWGAATSEAIYEDAPSIVAPSRLQRQFSILKTMCDDRALLM
jgi:hypothetical protein